MDQLIDAWPLFSEDAIARYQGPGGNCPAASDGSEEAVGEEDDEDEKEDDE